MPNNIAALGTNAYVATAAIIRPNNVTPYSINDVVGGVLTFPNMGLNAESVLINAVQLELDVPSVTGTPNFNLYFYNAAPPSNILDNAPFDLPASDRAAFLGVINIGSVADLGSTLYAEIASISRQTRLLTNALYGYLVTSAVYTPAAVSETYKVSMHTVSI